MFRTPEQACAAYATSLGGQSGGAPQYEGDGQIRCFYKEGDYTTDQIAAYVECPPFASAASMTACVCDGTLVPKNGWIRHERLRTGG